MAETPEETPENLPEEVENAAEAGGDTTGSTQSTASTGTGEAADAQAASADEVGRGDERSEADKPAAPAGTTRREKLEARRAERRSQSRPPRTPEERAKERLQRREHTAAERRRYRARTKAKKAELRSSQPAPEADHAPEHGPGRAKVRQGIVVSDKADKTITVRIDVVRRHKRYHKIMRTSIKLHAHDESNDAGTGDTVRVQECRPMSRSKRWRLIEVVERAK